MTAETDAFALRGANRKGYVLTRSVIVAILAGALLLALLAPAPAAAAEGPWQRLPAAAALLDGADPVTRGLSLELPLVADDGSAVALTVAAEAPVEVIHLFATRNPAPEIAVYRFLDGQVQPRVATRVRLNESQTVIALARTANGRWLAASREIRITVSGCLARAEDADPDAEMSTRVRAPSRLRLGEAGELLAMITHPMETGLREGPDGTLVARRLVSEFEVALAGTPLFAAEFHAAVSANPFLRLQLAPEAAGELELRWVEDGGREAVARAEVTLR
ncbi:MAG: thiosulfate oxidation carrier complex protein SoxZ [Gammaproteobacteria bacterium]|nr:thiosulfate oxidation carrier complex protein SoxZ [Gammaproteobacteria bacterium]